MAQRDNGVTKITRFQELSFQNIYLSYDNNLRILHHIYDETYVRFLHHIYDETYARKLHHIYDETYARIFHQIRVRVYTW